MNLGENILQNGKSDNEFGGKYFTKCDETKLSVMN
jgi:hypothetical protein